MPRPNPAVLDGLCSQSGHRDPVDLPGATVDRLCAEFGKPDRTAKGSVWWRLSRAGDPPRNPLIVAASSRSTEREAENTLPSALVIIFDPEASDARHAAETVAIKSTPDVDAVVKRLRAAIRPRTMA